MSDIFREVDEEIRRERYKSLWDRFGPYVIAVAVLIVVATAGYRGWQYWQTTAAREAGDRFIQAINLSDEDQQQEAIARLEGLSDATGGYPLLSRMRKATDLALSGQKEEALAEFDAVAADGSYDGVYRDLAALRAGYLAMESEDYAGVADRLEALTGEDNPWRFLAREALAFAAWKDGDNANVRKWLDGIVEAEGVPAEVESRANLLLELLNAAEGTPEEGKNS
ncbi:tetratricopeptide repeat protein [Rhizobiales bacterium]|uniref:tetratricopeptide repeat protein n=1 Tax=Hongsoonwoonella zoysiae TaxID=2821844 RepID=UPI00155F9F0F|nr:tetratricopeptide repeat protein [Hongsoonwoonella zoysiae]NRG18964.1 tetratricopeptide repeat protein [Hongsoonwoonella zoysiae]